MTHYPYLIVGGGMTADAAARAIREADPANAVGLISAEPHPPYARPPLSKGLWKGDPESGIWRGTETAGVDVRLDTRVTAIDAKRKTVTDERGNAVTYGKLLLATGGTPRRLSMDTGQIIYYRTYDDYRRLRALANERLRFAVLGGGFIGTEIAAALQTAGREVVMLVPEAGLGARVFPADLSHVLVGYYREQGVDVRTGEGLAGLRQHGGKVVVKTTSGQELPVDVIVAGLGIQPNVDLAEQAGVRVDNGIVVDELLRTSVPDIFAAGDVANFFNPALGTRMRVEHEDNANTMGAMAGRSMAGRGTPYTHLPFFYSDLFALGYEAVGELDPRLETVSDWKEPFREGVVYYVKGGRVRGVLLWNTWGQVDAARALIAEPGPVRGESLKGRLPA
ncbi:MAG TPA: FAD-dependent oxidoreductase [Gemmatimonadales bacterium]|jgi:NADPH-dependent 2,4-dienoyl-CoA reductase/sulfur reductase-like enzyme|nr:FAD-dependent oxidoreductase [Gemmatimonadales bacterium]